MYLACTIVYTAALLYNSATVCLGSCRCLTKLLSALRRKLVLGFMAAGQFDDPLEYQMTAMQLAPNFNPREGQAFIDDPLLQWSDEEEDGLESSSQEGDSEDVESWDDGVANVDDEDWEIAERGDVCLRF